MQEFLIKDVNSQPNIYASHHKIEIPAYLSQADAQKLAILEDNRYIIYAGTVFPSNNSNAKGIVVNDYDVTNNDFVGAICVHGAIYKSKLPKMLTTEAEAALNKIYFVEPKITLEPTIKLLGDEYSIALAAIPEAGVEIEQTISLENANFRKGYTEKEILDELYIQPSAANLIIESIKIEFQDCTLKLKILPSNIPGGQDGELSIVITGALNSSGKTTNSLDVVFIFAG